MKQRDELIKEAQSIFPLFRNTLIIGVKVVALIVALVLLTQAYTSCSGRSPKQTMQIDGATYTHVERFGITSQEGHAVQHHRGKTLHYWDEPYGKAICHWKPDTNEYWFIASEGAVVVTIGFK